MIKRGNKTKHIRKHNTLQMNINNSVFFFPLKKMKCMPLNHDLQTFKNKTNAEFSLI